MVVLAVMRMSPRTILASSSLAPRIASGATGALSLPAVTESVLESCRHAFAPSPWREVGEESCASRKTEISPWIAVSQKPAPTANGTTGAAGLCALRLVAPTVS